jgi:hypothetical protein
MGISEKLLGPKSKYDETIPYTYMARVYTIEGENDIYSDSFSDTICGLIEYLDEHNIDPANAELFGIYKKKNLPLDIQYCIDKDSAWLKRPNICRSIEKHYKESLEEQYKGHIKKGECDYEDRDRKANGVYHD